MGRIITKCMQKLSSVVLMAAIFSLSQCCMGDFHQIKVPNELKQYLKENKIKCE